jgi:hypothetical protein
MCQPCIYFAYYDNCTKTCPSGTKVVTTPVPACIDCTGNCSSTSPK